ncbi:MAG: hypothetical protein ACI35T_02330 [Alistipes sp.]
MMRLYIDGRPCDLAEESVVVPCGFDAATLADAASWRTGSTLSLSLPSTPANDAVFGCSHDIYAAERFNASLHPARIEVGTATLMEGRAVLVATRFGQEDSGYEVRITGGAAQWAEQAAHTPLSASGIDFDMTLTPTDIVATWEGEHAVRFLPVCHDDSVAEVSSSLVPVQKVMLTDDYHPFVSVAALVRDVFESAGYTLQSRFFGSDLARSLYVGGVYRAVDASRQKERMDFLARRKGAVSADADALGRVYASPAVALHSLGNVVDTADATAVDDEGKTMTDTFTKGDCFMVDDDGFACFVPAMTATVGFLLHLEYETDYRILSRTRLAGFDTVTAMNGVKAKFALANPFTDRRGAIVAGIRYRVVVFGHTEGRGYLFKCGAKYLASFSDSSTTITIPDDAVSTECSLLFRDSSSIAYTEYGGDWAMYDGYVVESGSAMVEVDVRIPACKMSAGSKQRLDTVCFEGADAGMSLTLSPRTSLRPIFSTEAGYGSRLTTADILPDNVSMLDLVDGVARMFNLRIFTDLHERKVFVEPEEEFYADTPTVDWSSRIDFSQPLWMVDAAIDAPQWRVFGYGAGDEAVAEFNADNDTVLGEWNTENPLYGTLPKSEQMRIDLFAPTVNRDGAVVTAPSASLMRFSDAATDGESADGGVPMRIVRYCGLQPLPEGERWGFPHDAPTYPYAAFFGTTAGEEFTLGFENRDGAQGLHRYYDDALARERNRSLLHASLLLAPEEREHLVLYDAAVPSFRSRFRLTVGGQSSIYRLRSIADYDAEKCSTECVFERLNDDE